MEVDLLEQLWLPMSQIERLNWKLICLYEIIKFVNPLMRITAIGEFVVCVSSFFPHSNFIFHNVIFLVVFSSVFFCSSKYFPEHKLPENVIATTDAKAALLGADFCFHAVPVQVIQIIFSLVLHFPRLYEIMLDNLVTIEFKDMGIC